MSKAVICPVCNGEGNIKNKNGTSASKTCHGCYGKGWVEVGDDRYIYYLSPIFPRYNHLKR